MSTDNVFLAFSPGNKLTSLETFAPKLITARVALNDLIIFPHLESMIVGNDGSKDAQNLYQLVNAGIARFNNLTSINIGLARNVISYDSAFTNLVDSFNIETLVETMQPVAKEHAALARGHSEYNQSFFKEFTEYLDNINERIGEMDNKISELDKKIRESSGNLASQGIVETLWKTLKDVYRLAPEAIKSKSQLARLLQLTLKDLAGTFDKLFEEKYRLEKILKSLRAIQDELRRVKTKFIALSKGLMPVLDDSASLLDVWEDVYDRMVPVAHDTSMVPPATSTVLKKAWSELAKAARAYCDAVLGSPDRTPPQGGHKSLALPIPVTEEEITMAEWVLELSSADDVTASSGESPDYSILQSDEDIVKRVLNPPNTAVARLQALADHTGKIINQFDELIQQPYVEQLVCTDPRDPEGKKKVSVYAMTAHYRSEYQKLQGETRAAARNLKTYATSQKLLLPKVKAGKQVGSGDIDVKTFIETNRVLVEKYKEQAAGLTSKYNDIKDKWDMAINVVEKSITECTATITKWEKSIGDMTREMKRRLLYSALLAVGAFVVFASRAFIPGGILAALGIAGYLGRLSIEQLIQAGKIIIAIRELFSAIAIAKETRTKLERLLPYLKDIAKSLSDVASIWNDISQSTNNLDGFYMLLAGPTGSVVLDKLRSTIIENWDAVSKACTRYLEKTA